MPNDPSGSAGVTSGSHKVAQSREIHSDGGQSRLDALLEAMGSQRRRYALYYLQERVTATLPEVAERVAILECDEPSDAIDSATLDRVHADFYHCHLPKLVEANLIEYDPRERMIRYAEPPDRYERFIDLACNVEHPEDDSD